MKKIANYIKLYWWYIRNHLLGLIEYKMDFIIGIFSSLIEQLLSLIFIIIIFSNIQDIKGWTYGELLFIFSIATLGRSIHLVFFDNLWTFGTKYIQMGDLDRLLIRPVNPLFQVIADKINFQGVGQVVVGVMALVYSNNSIYIKWNLTSIIILVLLILGSGIIYVNIHIFFMTFSFWMVDSLPIVSSIFSINQFAQYPLQIYPKIIRFIITCIIPYSFVAFVPANYFLKSNQYSYLVIYMPLICIITSLISYLFWNYGLKRFESVGN